MARDGAGRRAKARAAEVLREGGTQREAARAGGVSVRQVQRWAKEPAFAALLRRETLVTAGHVQHGHADADVDPLGGLPPSRAWVSCPDLAVIGSALHPLASSAPVDDLEPEEHGPSVVEVEFCLRPERIAHVRERLAAGEVPDPPSAEPVYVQPFTLFGLLAMQADRSKLVSAIGLSGAGKHLIIPDAA
ncbi:MAG TPA: hypothetical protein VE596_13855 [Gaiellaceae bacterium]|nr:hypothetical protein [Gaiellaceae bacterium]